MTTKYKRIPVQLEPEVEEAITKLAALTNTSKSATIQALLRQTLPAIHMMINAFTLLAEDSNKNMFPALQTVDAGVLDALQELMKARSMVHDKARSSADGDD